MHVIQGVLENGTRHGHSKIIRWVNTDFNRVWQKNFFSIIELSNHVVGTWKETCLVERTGFNHWAREGSNTDEQTGTIERSSSFEQSCTFEGFTLSGIGITVGPTERRSAF